MNEFLKKHQIPPEEICVGMIDGITEIFVVVLIGVKL